VSNKINENAHKISQPRLCAAAAVGAVAVVVASAHEHLQLSDLIRKEERDNF
jgi:hypothetical protein